MENNIKLRFSIKDIVWFMLSNQAMSAPIANWSVSGNYGTPITVYYVTLPGVHQGLEDRYLFTSKEELLNSL